MPTFRTPLSSADVYGVGEPWPASAARGSAAGNASPVVTSAKYSAADRMDRVHTRIPLLTSRRSLAVILPEPPGPLPPETVAADQPAVGTACQLLRQSHRLKRFRVIPKELHAENLALADRVDACHLQVGLG